MYVSTCVLYVRTYFHNSRRSNNLGTDMERNGAWERERVGAGDGGGPRGAGIYVRTYVCTHVRTYLRAYVRTYLCMYIRTYTFVAGCSNAYVCTDMLRTYVSWKAGRLIAGRFFLARRLMNTVRGA